MLDGVIVFGARFGGDDVGDAMNEIGVPSGGQANGLRENSGMTSARDAVQAFVPPVIGGNAEARDGLGDILHLGSFFFEGHARDEIVDALIDGKAWIQIRWSRRLGRSSGVRGRLRRQLSGVEKNKGRDGDEAK